MYVYNISIILLCVGKMYMYKNNLNILLCVFVQYLHVDTIVLTASLACVRSRSDIVHSSFMVQMTEIPSYTLFNLPEVYAIIADFGYDD
jgi:hypothetical protein